MRAGVAWCGFFVHLRHFNLVRHLPNPHMHGPAASAIDANGVRSNEVNTASSYLLTSRRASFTAAWIL